MKDLRDLRLRPGERVFLDRIEEGVATLLLGPDGKQEESVPREQLPPDVREGQTLRVSPAGHLEVDDEATEAGHDAVQSLMDELLRQDPPERT
jgi:Protein of unknown function (DUF3006)